MPRWDVGRAVFGCLGDKVSTFLAFTDAGSGFVFGYLVDQKPFNTQGLEPNSTAMQVAAEINDARAINFVFMFKILSVIYFFRCSKELNAIHAVWFMWDRLCGTISKFWDI